MLRGVALLGILVVNMDSFAWPIEDYRLGWAGPVALWDRLAGWGIRTLAEGKFYPLFSFLFGLGMAMQMRRAEAGGARFVPQYLRRLLWLFVFGAAHVWFLWYGDVLTTYAVLGVPLLVFRRQSARTLVIVASACMVVAVLVNAGLLALAAAPAVHSDSPGANVMSPSPGPDLLPAIHVYGEGAFEEIRDQRLRDFAWALVLGFPALPIIFAMFLLGFVAGRDGIFHEIGSRLAMFRRVAVWSGVVGLASTLAHVLSSDLVGAPGPATLEVARVAAGVVGGPALTLCYVSGIALLCHRPGWRARLARLAPVGRMPLTNYLLQSVVCTTIFYGYGFGLYGRVGLAEGLALAVAIYLGQVQWSGWWFRRFAYGPLEWAWRVLTYGRTTLLIGATPR